MGSGEVPSVAASTYSTPHTHPTPTHVTPGTHPPAPFLAGWLAVDALAEAGVPWAVRAGVYAALTDDVLSAATAAGAGSGDDGGDGAWPAALATHFVRVFAVVASGWAAAATAGGAGNGGGATAGAAGGAFAATRPWGATTGAADTADARSFAVHAGALWRPR